MDNTSIAPVDDGAIMDANPRNLNIEGGILYCKINHTAFYAWFRIREQSAAHASQSNGWSPMVFLAPRSNVILFGACWWVNSSGIWKHEELKAQYIGSCRDPSAADFAAEGLRQYRITELRTAGHQTGRMICSALAA